MKIEPIYWKLYIPQHILFVGGIVAIALGFASPWWLLAPFLGYLIMGYIGGAIFIHRYWCHESFETNKWLARLGAYLGAVGGMGSPLAMCAVHMFMHHPHSDTPRDPHTPVGNGVLHSWITWKNIPEERFKTAFMQLLKSRKRVLRDKWVVFIHRHFYLIWWLTLAILLLVDWRIALFWFGGGGVYSFHIEGFVNSYCHGASTNGYRLGDTRDHSINHGSKIMMYLSLGNTLHHNHHLHPAAYSYKMQTGEFDLAHYLVPLIAIDKK